MWNRLTEDARRVIYAAEVEAKQAGSAMVGVDHLMLALLSSGEPIDSILEAMGTSAGVARDAIEKENPRSKANDESVMSMTPPALRVLSLALTEARELHEDLIGPPHLLLAISREGGSASARFLAKYVKHPTSAREIVGRVVGTSPRSPRTVADESTGFLTGPCLRTHLLLAMIADRDDPAGQIIRALCSDVGALQWRLWREIVAGSKEKRPPFESHMVDRLLATASSAAKGGPIDSRHLLVALFAEGCTAYGDILEQFGVDLVRVHASLL